MVRPTYFELRQRLPQAPDIGPRILAQALEPRREIEHRVLVSALERAELGPVDRRRHRRARPRAGGVGRDRRCFAAVAQIVDENAIVALCSWWRSRYSGRVVRRHGGRDGVAEILGLVPWHRPDRQHHVQPFAARGLHETLEFQPGQPLAHLDCGGDHVPPSGAWAGVEIEYQPVGTLAVIDGGPAGVDFQHAGLHQRDQPVEIVDRNNLVALLSHEMQMFGGDAGGGMLLEKTLPGGARRASQQRNRSANHMRPHPFPDMVVELGEIAFCDAWHRSQ